MRFNLRTVIIASMFLCMLLTYVGSYYRLSRRGMREAEVYELDGFFYVPIDDVMRSQDVSEQRRYAIFFAPANLVDRNLFNGKPAITSLTWGLSP